MDFIKVHFCLVGLVLIALNLNFSYGLPTGRLFSRDLVSPENDPFYDPPAGYEHTSPGTVLKIRELDNTSLAAFSQIPVNLKGAYQLLYRTTDNLNQSTATVTTLLVPENASSDKVVSYQVAEDSAFIECAPSYTLQNASATGIVEVLFMSIFLNKGYYVNVPDYEGPKSSFTAGYMSGYATLDSIRGILTTQETTGLNENAKVAIIGYSGGALATGWTLQLQKWYAQDLPIIAASMGGTVVRANESIAVVNGGPSVGLVPTALMALTRVYEDYKEYLYNLILPDKLDEMESVFSQCLSESSVQFANKDMATYFSRPDYLNDEIPKRIMEENEMGKMGAPSPDIAIYMFHTTKDELVPIEPAQQMYHTWCNDGANIEFTTDNVNNHGMLSILNAPNSIKFIQDRFEGIPPESGCTDQSVSLTSLPPDTEKVVGQEIFQLVNETVASLGQLDH